MSDKKTGIDQALIRDLANILNETDLTEIEVEQNDLRIRVSRNGTTQLVQGYGPQPMQYGPGPMAAAMPAPLPEAPVAKGFTVMAPMVGTCYLTPAPGSRPFVEVGSIVTEGQTILIIEAMKTMNQIAAPRSGKVTQIMVEDTRPVEYGEPLIVIE